MPAWLDTLLVIAAVSGALGYLGRRWLRRRHRGGVACGTGGCCPAHTSFTQRTGISNRRAFSSSRRT